MSKKIKNLTILVLSLCCSLGFVACGGGKDSSQASTNSEASVSEESTQSSVEDSSEVKESYTVTFNADGGSEVEAQTVGAGALATEPTVPSKAGYTFAGWYVGGTEFNFLTAITGNVTLTAKWTANEDTFYNVEVYMETVDGQFVKLTQQEVGSTVSLVRVGTTDSSVDLTVEATQILATMPGFELDETQSTLTGNINGDGSSVFKVYFARKMYTLSFSGVTAESMSIKYGATVDFESLPTIPAQTNKISVWKLDGTTISADFEWTYTENKTLTAVYMGTPRTVNFVVDGEIFATEIVENNTTVAQPATNPQKVGYTFAGWYLDETEFDFTNPITGDTTMTANFTPNSYTLMLDKQEGVGDDDSVTVTYNAAIPAIPTITKPGYEFVGWTIDGEFIDNETVWTYTENKTAVAHWSKQSYTVTFNVEGLTIPGTTAEYNGTVTAPTVAGYDITWDFDFETPITGSIEITGTKALKGFALKENSAMYTDQTGNVEVEYNDDGEFGIITSIPCNVVGAKLKFDLTAEDIEVFKSLGYTHITYMLNCGASYPAGSNSEVSILHGARNVDIELNAWNKIVISLEEFEEYFTSGEGVFVQNGWVAYSANLKIKDISLSKVATVTYKDGDDVLKTSIVEKGDTITAMSIPGYDVVWMNGDAEFDFSTEINEDITLTATAKTLKQIKLTADSVITTADGDTALTLDAEGGLGAKVNTSSSNEYSFKLNWKFDLTAEDIEAFKAMGYTHFTFKLYVWSSAKDFTTFTILNKAKTVDVVEGSYTDVTITLDELATYITSGDGKFHSSTWLMYYQGSAAIKDMALTTRATVTYMDGENVIGVTYVNQGGTVNAISIPGYDVVWMNGDTPFDFATEIYENITLTVGSKTLRGFALKETSVMFTNGGNVAIEYNEAGEFGIITSTPCNLIGAKLKFDLTVEDIANFRALGYTHITYMLNCGVSYPAGSNSFVSILHGKRNVEIVLNAWNEIVISLDEFEEYFTSGEGVFVQNGWVAYSASLRIKDISLAKMATVTYKDGDDVIKTSIVEKGGTVSAMSIPGYDVVWMNGDTEFDFATEINEDITLTAATKTLKQIKLTADSVITTADGDTALTTDAEGGIGVKVNTSSSGGYSFKLNWKFDLTAEDIEAFKTMGYTHFTFKLYVWSSAKDFTTFTILNKTKTVDVVEGSYVDVTITLDELSTYVTSGNGNFHSSTWLMYYQGEARIKGMALVMGAN